MEISVLASGSSGNSTFIQNDETTILIDAGISSRNLIKKLSNIGKEIKEIDAVFITHEHTDHIKGVERISKKFNIPIFMNKQTFINSNLEISPKLMKTGETFSFGSLSITSFPISHDAAEPVGYKIVDKKAVSIITDLGKTDSNIKKIVSESNCVILETNHDIEMLLNGPYPYDLKQRILSDKGHLSNIDAGLLIRDYGENLEKVFLAHISQNNNTPELALNTISKISKIKAKKILTNQYYNTDLEKI